MWGYYRTWYPHYTWNYPVGYRINTISSWDAQYCMGEVRKVYGKVYETYYSESTDSYYLYFGAPYPYHVFTVIIPGWEANKFNYSILDYFDQRYVNVTGLISEFEQDGKPEIVIKSPRQIRLY